MSIGTFNSFVVLDEQNFITSTSTAANNDVPLTASVVLIAPSADGDIITGLKPPREESGGRVTVVNKNTSTRSISLPGNDSRSIDRYRFYYPDGMSGMTLGPQESLTFNYSSGMGWRAHLGPVDSGSTSGGGPLPSTATPTAVSSAGTPGVSAAYSRGDHGHADSAQTAANTLNISSNSSAISANAAAIATLSSALSGLVIPPASTAVPQPNSGAGSPGSSAGYARGDHAHPAVAVPSASTAVPTFLAPTASVGSSAGYARGDHQHALPSISANSTPGRSLNGTPFQISTDKYAFVSYTVSITCAALLIAGQDGRAYLLSDSSTAPSTVRASLRNANSGVLSLTSIQEASLNYIVPPAHYVSLPSSNIVSTPTFTLVRQTEQIIG